MRPVGDLQASFHPPCETPGGLAPNFCPSPRSASGPFVVAVVCRVARLGGKSVRVSKLGGLATLHVSPESLVSITEQVIG